MADEPRATEAPAPVAMADEQNPKEQKQGGPRAIPSRGPPPFPRQSSPRGRPPSAEEMIKYYSRKGLDKQAASEKVIEDLQTALTLAVSRYPRKAQEAEKSVRTVSGTLDSFSKRLGDLEAKVDDRPDLGGVFVAGVAAGGFLNAVPHIVRACSQIGQSLKQAVSSKP